MNWKYLTTISLSLILSACTAVGVETQIAPAPTANPVTAPTANPIAVPTVTIAEAMLFEADFEAGITPGINTWNLWATRQYAANNTVYCNAIVDDWAGMSFGSEDWADYAFEADFQVMSQNPDPGYEMYIRYIGSGDGYRATVSNKTWLGMTYYPPGDILAEQAISIARGEWHTLRVEVVGETFQFFFDDAYIDKFSDDSRATGLAGIGAFPNTQVCVDNIRVWGIDASGPVPAPSSEYFEKVELLEFTNIPLTIGAVQHTITTSAIHDMDDDAIADVILTISTYPDQILHPIVVLSGSGDNPVNNIASQIFPNGITTLRNSPHIFFADIDNDNHEDLLFAEAGIDHPPWVSPDAQIGIAMYQGGGIFEDASATVPQEAIGLRNYSLAAGDLYNDGITRIVLPSQAVTGVAPNFSGPEKSGLLSWNGGGFDFQQNWIDMSLWWWPENLFSSSFMSVQDIDGDGWQDLYISGSSSTPNHRILYGNNAFPSQQLLFSLPEGPYGHTPWDTFNQPNVEFAQGSDVNRVVFEDFDSDGDLDIVSVSEEVQLYKAGVFTNQNHWDYTNIFQNGGIVYGNVWFQVLRNDGQRQFVDVIAQGRDLGPRYYISLLPMDFDLDGDTDLVGQYWSKTDTGECVPRWGSTILINEGNLVFDAVDTAEVFPELSPAAGQASSEAYCATLGLGVLFPTVINEDGITGLLVAPNEDYSSDPELRVLRFHATGQFHIPD